MYIKVEVDHLKELIDAINNHADAMRILSASGNCISEMIGQAVETHTATLQEVEPVEVVEPVSNPEPLEVPVKTNTPEKNKTSITLEAVRARLSKLSNFGKQAEIKQLLNKYGASKLTDIAKEHYEAVYHEAEGL
jgi:hypothetical protein